MEYILERFRKSVREKPDAPFLYDDLHPAGVTWAEFDNLSGRVYGWLKARGIGREKMVLINLPRGIMPFVAAVGVWKAGAAFVIVEETYTPERVAFIRRDSGCAAELDRSNLNDVLSFESLEGYEITDPHDAAFAVYTSGTTGNPKGVLHEYGNIGRCVESLMIDGNPMLGKGVFRPYVSPQNFVAALIALTGMLASDHARMYIVSYAAAKDPRNMIRLFEKYRFNVLFLSPSYARVLVPEIAPFLRTLVLGSEPADNLFFPGLDTRNFYASSESYFVISSFRIDRAYGKAPVGRPAFPLDLRFLDEAGQDVPDGETGEIAFDAPYLRGYINLPEENEKAFVRGYFRTGDLGYRDEAGNLVLLGRVNDMFKINGNRVEPGEIESVTRRLLGIGWAAVRVFTEADGSGFICVYYTADVRFSADDLRKRMADYLPYYMIPSRFMRIDRIPLLPSGKLDRRALPLPEGENARPAYTAPENETEAALCRGFEKVLEIQAVGARDDFYELGGDSLRSIRLIMECGLPGLNAGNIFRGRTPRGIAEIWRNEHINKLNGIPEEQNRKAMRKPQPLTAEQLYMMDMQLYTPGSTMYNLATMLAADRYEIDAEKLAAAVGEVIRAHPSLLTELFFNEDGEVMQRYAPELYEPIRVEKVSEAELEDIRKSLVMPYSILVGSRLYRCRLFETEKRVCLFMDVHHIIFDGVSYRVFLDDISAVYTGGSPRPDRYYAVLENRANEQKSDYYRESRRYFESLYGGVRWSTLPETDEDSRENRLGQLSVPLGVGSGRIAAAERTWHVSRNEFFISVSLLAVAAYNRRNDVMMAWIYNGRDDPELLTTTGLLFRDLPVAVRLDQLSGPEELFARVHEQVRGGIGHSCYPYNERGFTLSDESGYGAYILYQHSIYDPVRFGNVLMKPVKVPVNNSASQTFLDILIVEGDEGITLGMDYMIPVYRPESIARFAELFRRIAEELCAAAERGGSGSMEDFMARIRQLL